LRELHLRILRNDPTIARRRNPAEAGGSVRSAGPVSNLIGPGASLTGLAAKGPAEVRVVPAQLPADVAAFTGRGGELAELDAVLVGPPSGSANEHDSRAVVISAVSGTAGVGKTALVVHWAHRVRKEFPDGQLYVNLRGYDPDRPMTAAEALAGFLGGLGVASQQVPLELAERAARFRTEVSGRRMLIVLDNASSLEQIRPLLPGTSSSAVVVTSRDSLAGLVAVHGAHRLDLDLLAPNEAIGLLRRLIGRGVDAEPEAAAGLAAHCARLPLALRVAAELAISRPGMGLADLVAELDDEQWRLELLNAEGDPNVPVGAVFSWSVRHLTPDAARAFALLGLHPGPNFDAHAAAALAGSSPQRAGRTLGLLVRAHLIHPTAAGRYGMHDLLRAYARHLTTQLNNRSTAQPIAQVTSGNDNEETSKGDVDSALSRLFDYYLCAVAAAMDALNRNGKAGPHPGPGIPAAATPAPLLPDQATARAWLDAELPTLTSVAAYTAAHGWPGHTVRLSTTLSHYLNGGGNHAEALAIQGHAHCASRQIGDRAAQAQALHGLGAVHLRMVRYGRAVEEFQQALALFRQLGDRVGQARALGALGTLERRLGRNQAAVGYAREAVALDREAGDWSGQAHALIGLGIVEARLGLYRQATEHHQQALALGRRVGDRSAEGWALGGLGVVETRTGRHAQAGEHLQQAMALTGQIGDEFGQGWALTSLGTLQIRLEGFEQATEYHRQALAIFRRIGDRDGEVWALNGLGEAAHAGTGTVGDPVVALTHHLTALTIATDIGIRDQQARANFGLGHSYLAIEEPTRACEHFERALTRYTELGMPDADAVHSELATLVQTVQKPDPVYAGAHSIQPQSN
jgi:tetratricopeptide (TPR) repeat protein